MGTFTSCQLVFYQQQQVCSEIRNSCLRVVIVVFVATHFFIILISLTTFAPKLGLFPYFHILITQFGRDNSYDTHHGEDDTQQPSKS